MSTASTDPPPTAGTGQVPVTVTGEPPVKFTRAAALWSSITAGFLILILLLVFIAQNQTAAPLTFLGWHWHLPLGVSILLAAVCGGLLTVAVGTARIIQLRRVAKRHHSVVR